MRMTALVGIRESVVSCCLVVSFVVAATSAFWCGDLRDHRDVLVVGVRNPQVEVTVRFGLYLQESSAYPEDLKLLGRKTVIVWVWHLRYADLGEGSDGGGDGP